MGKVSVTFELKPESPDVDLDELLDHVKQETPTNARVTDSKQEPIAFGLKKLLVQVTIPDSEGGTDAVEGMLEKLDGVQSVDIRGQPTRL